MKLRLTEKQGFWDQRAPTESGQALIWRVHICLNQGVHGEIYLIAVHWFEISMTALNYDIILIPFSHKHTVMNTVTDCQTK